MRTKKIAYLGLYMSIALVLSYVESTIPIIVGIPGVKLGLTNIVTVLMLYMVGPAEAIAVALGRTVISGFMFGNAFSIAYSLAGCILSFLCMYIAQRRTKLKMISISLIGGVMHNMGQLFVATLLLSKDALYYFPVLLLAGVITGLLIGIVSTEVFYRVQ